MQNKAELLVPAGTLDRLKTAILYGADAIYCGTPDMSLRTKSSFSLNDLIEGINYAHSFGKKVYLTLNLFAHNKDIEKLPKFINTIKKAKPDGLIIADPGIFNFVKKEAPELELHISTQANLCSYLSVQFWEEQGAKLVVLAREVNFEELKEIRKKCSNIKLEIFIHGAMCMTYSGRCLLSNFMTERGANQGSCAHSCRWKYKLKIKLKNNTEKEIEITDQNKDLFDFFLEEEIRPGDLMPFEEDMHGSYILNAKDLCLMPKLDKYLKIGIDSLKIEGRNKSEYYVGSVSRIYRRAIDDYYNDPESWDYKKYMKEINAISNRGYTLAFHEGRLTNLAHDYDSTKSSSIYEYVARVRNWEDDYLIIDIKNQIRKGDVLEFLSPNRKDPILLRIYEFENAVNGNINDVVNQSQKNEGVKIYTKSFHQENISDLKELLPELTLIRKDKNLDLTEKRRIDLHNASSDKEISKKNKLYDKKREKYQSLLENCGSCNDITPNSAKIGIDGCCGKGCNGCLIFWHDDKYQKARELLGKKKIGEML